MVAKSYLASKFKGDHAIIYSFSNPSLSLPPPQKKKKERKKKRLTMTVYSLFLEI